MVKRNFYLFVTILVSLALLSGCGKKDDEAKTDKQKIEEKKDVTTQQQIPQTEQKKDTTKQNVKTENPDGTVPDSETKKEEKSSGNIMKIETTMGLIKIKLFPDKAPKTVAQIKELVGKGFYNGVIFHRVIDGFMIQGGDPSGTGTKGSGKTIPDEFANGLKHDKKGVVAMANTGRPDSQDSQFYITLAATPHLDGKYTIFGEVIDGQSVVDKIGKVKTGPGDKPVEEVKMTKVSLIEK